MKKILEIIKQIILSFIILYSYNLIAVNFNMMIPINVVTVLAVAFLKLPALVAIILFKIIIL